MNSILKHDLCNNQNTEIDKITLFTTEDLKIYFDDLLISQFSAQRLTGMIFYVEIKNQ